MLEVYRFNSALAISELKSIKILRKIKDLAFPNLNNISLKYKSLVLIEFQSLFLRDS